MPRKGGGKKSGARRGKTGNSADKAIVGSHKVTGSTTTIVRSDLTHKRQNFNLVSAPPRNIPNQTYWIEISNDSQIGVSSTGITEANFAFQASNISSFANFAACFDQYCLYSVCVSFASMSFAGTTGVNAPFRLYSAIDYDSVAVLGSKLLLQAYGSFEYAALAQDGASSFMRYVKPCLSYAQESSTLLPVPSGISRAWIDSAYPSITHYGLRTIVDTYPSTIAAAIEVSFTYVIGFRNNF
jgi:hypothetical protein